MQLYFIRHGQSTNNALWDSTSGEKVRVEDPELSEIGKKQAQHLAEYVKRKDNGYTKDGPDIKNLNGFHFSHLYTSLMVRSVATGTALSKAIDLPLVAWPDLHEGGGIYLNDKEKGELIGLPGKNRSYFETTYPGLELPESLNNEGWWNRPYETRPQRRERAQRVYVELLERHAGTDDRVAVISHGGFYNHLLATILELPDKEANPSQVSVEMLNDENVILNSQKEVWFSMNNTAITRIDFYPDGISLTYQNHTDHLPAELIT